MSGFFFLSPLFDLSFHPSLSLVLIHSPSLPLQMINRKLDDL